MRDRNTIERIVFRPPEQVPREATHRCSTYEDASARNEDEVDAVERDAAASLRRTFPLGVDALQRLPRPRGDGPAARVADRGRRRPAASSTGSPGPGHAAHVSAAQRPGHGDDAPRVGADRAAVGGLDRQRQPAATTRYVSLSIWRSARCAAVPASTRSCAQPLCQADARMTSIGRWQQPAAAAKCGSVTSHRRWAFRRR